MPLKAGHSREVVSHNIKEMMAAGHPQKQAIAAALSSARKYKKMADGGQVSQDDVPEPDKKNAADMQKGATEPGSLAQGFKNLKSGLGLADGGTAKPKTIGDIIGYPQGASLADGGEVSEDMDEGLGTTDSDQAERSLNQIRVEGEYHPAEVMNPEHQEHDRMLARALYKKGEADELMSYAMGGLVQDGPEGDEPVGNKPEEDMASSSEESMSEGSADSSELGHEVIEGVPESPGLSKEAAEAIAERKKKRRYA